MNPLKLPGAACRWLAAALSGAEVEKPVFIVGCGRSGTTVLGEALAQHPLVTHLSERRDLWFKAFPESDIWTPKAVERRGRLDLHAEDADEERGRKLRRIFFRETAKSGKPVLIEKLPINNFRLEFIRKLFPDARYVHIFRNGLEVARSIEKLSHEHRWFGRVNYKWGRLEEYAQRHEATAKLPELCDDFLTKGLLEWRLSTEAAVRFLERQPAERYLEFSYRHFMEDPEGTLLRILAFSGLPVDEAPLAFVREKISRRTSRLDGAELTAVQREVGGPLLPLSIDPDCESLTAAGISTPTD